jgi:hypothetical protein
MPMNVSNIPEQNAGDAQFVLGWLAGAISQTLRDGELHSYDRARLLRAEQLYNRYVEIDRARAQEAEKAAQEVLR